MESRNDLEVKMEVDETTAPRCKCRITSIM